MKIQAYNRSDLLSILSDIDVHVPLRSEGRSTKHCEIWSICNWLTTVSNLIYPITLIHGDKPDFHLISGDKDIGIEHTEAITQEYAHACVLHEKADDDSILDMSLFPIGEKKNKHEIRELISLKKLTGPGWEGDVPEEEWASDLYKRIEGKTLKLRNDDFEKHEKNYLLIYENLPLPYLDYTKACKLLELKLKVYWESGVVFTTVYIQTDYLLMSFNSLCFSICKNNRI
ncbi:MAG TPA: hypothetical protein PKY58_04815 [Syntrophales bacterium]|nr:hypothetical protein [Syntrophales bacterium]HQN78000.1 hypothetical protein [Syntrophales bacterium]HQQ26828.1 hypothetical protein [Syntrophales bacterium]